MKVKEINSAAVAFFLCANPIAWVIPFIPSAIVFIVALCWLVVLSSNPIKHLINAPVYTHYFVFASVILFIISWFLNERTTVVEYFTFFLVCGVSGVYFSHLDFSINKVIKYIALIAVFLSIYVFTIDYGDPTIERVDYGMWMGISYGVLRFILALLLVLLFYKSDYALLVKLLFVGALSLYLLIYMSYASRGAILGIIIFLFSYFYLVGSPLKKWIIVVIGLALGILVLFQFNNIILLISNSLSLIGVEFRALEKLQTLIMADNLDNGRSILIRQGFEGIIQSPIFGHGIGGFEDSYGVGYYVHNLFIQIFYEGGLILFLPIVAIFGGASLLFFGNVISKEERIFILYLFCAGILELFFSNVFWKSMFFWFFVFYIIRMLFNTFFLIKIR